MTSENEPDISVVQRDFILRQNYYVHDNLYLDGNVYQHMPTIFSF